MLNTIVALRLELWMFEGKFSKLFVMLSGVALIFEKLRIANAQLEKMA